MTDLQGALRSAEQWLLHSGIQRTDLAAEMKGGMYAWFDRRTRAHSFLYPEITGYAVTTFVYLYRLRSNPLYLNRARLAADWLVEEARAPETGAMRVLHDANGWDETLYAFDNGICMNGLVNLYKCTADQRYLDAACTIADWLTSTMQRADGGFLPICNSETQAPHDPATKWSTTSGSFLVKLAIAFLNLSDATQRTTYADSARRLCDWGVQFQRSDGRFPTSPSTDAETFVHPHCYTAEGLLVAGKLLQEQRYLEAAARAVHWIASRQLPGGGSPAYFADSDFVPTESADITSQVLRLALLLPEHLSPSSDFDVEAAVRAIIASQCAATDREATGGFAAGQAWFYGEPIDRTGEHINAWATMFAVQALSLASSRSYDLDPYLIV